MVLFGLLAVAHTWPLAHAPARWRPAHHDVLSGMWSLQALSHQLVNDPTHPLDGNIFSPFANSVAIVDHQFANAILAAPLVASGVDAVQVVNVIILLSFWLGGVFTCLLVQRLTGSTSAGLVAGCAYAFSSYHALQFPRVHLLATHWLPLAALAWHGYIDRPSWRRWAGLLIASLLLAFSSWHMAVIGGAAMAIVVVWTAASTPGQVRRPLIGLALVAVVCALALLPLARAYAHLGDDWPPRTGDGRETVETLAGASADIVGLVARPPNTRVPYNAWLFSTAVRDHGVFPGAVVAILAVPAVLAWRRRTPTASAPLPWPVRWWIRAGVLLAGVISLAALAGPAGDSVVGALRPLAPFVVLGLGLAAAGIVWARRARREAQEGRLTCTYLALAVAGAMLALGPRVAVFGTDVGSGLWRFDLLPVGLIIRAPERLSLLLVLGTSVLAGVGAARWIDRRPRSVRVVASAAVLIALNVDLAFAVGPLVAVPGRDRVDHWLADTTETGAVIDYPLQEVNRWAIPASRNLDRPFVNGGGYLRPPAYTPMTELADLSPEQLALLWEHFHPRLVVVRTDRYPATAQAAVLDAIAGASEALRPLARLGPDLVFELVDRGRGAELFRRWPREALEGRQALVFAGAVTSGREETIGRLTVRLNGRTLLSTAGEDVEQPSSYLVPFEPQHLVDGVNTFEIVAGYDYRPPVGGHAIGTTGVALAADVSITSDRLRAVAVVNGHLLRGDRGYLLAELDAETGQVARVGRFDVSWSAEASASLATFVDDIPTGAPVVVMTEFDAGRELTAAAVDALAGLGLRTDLRGQFQTMHAAIGVKGAPPGSAPETTGRFSAGLELGSLEPREVQLASLEVR